MCVDFIKLKLNWGFDGEDRDIISLNLTRDRTGKKNVGHFNFNSLSKNTSHALVNTFIYNLDITA